MISYGVKNPLDTQRACAHTECNMMQERCGPTVENKMELAIAGLDTEAEGTTTLLGERGEQLVRNLSAVAVGTMPTSTLGRGCVRAPDGALRLVVDRASFEALGIRI